MSNRPRLINENPETLAEVARVVSDVDDRAWLVCDTAGCKNAAGGRCTVFAMKDVPPLRPDKLCPNYSDIHGKA